MSMFTGLLDTWVHISKFGFTIHYFESQEPGAKQAEHQIHTRSERSWASSVCVSLTIHFKIKWNKHVLLKWGDNMEASF